MGLSELYSTFFREFVLGAGFSGFWGGVLQAILGRRRRRGWAILPRNSGVLGGVWARRGDSAHGGHGRANWAKNFLKIFKKRGEKPGKWGARGAGRWCRGTLYRVCEVIFRSGG